MRKFTSYWLVENLLIIPVICLLVAIFVAYDRRDPFDYINTWITPEVATSGQEITVHREIIWRRQCEGEAWTEVVGSDRIMAIYDRGARYPAQLGETFTERKLTLSKALPNGAAIFRGVIKFKACGLTSRWVALEVPYQVVEFMVKN